MAIRAGYYLHGHVHPPDGERLHGGAGRRGRRADGRAAHPRRAPHRLRAVPPAGAPRRATVFGGFCYFNNAAIAAHLLSQHGRVVLLDIDYHHGNGSQDIFYKRSDVSFISIHGHPNHAYPYFSGFADERGADDGFGYNLNIPLPEHADDDVYALALKRALAAVDRHRPRFLVVSLGLDIARNESHRGLPVHGQDVWPHRARAERARLAGALRPGGRLQYAPDWPPREEGVHGARESALMAGGCPRRRRLRVALAVRDDGIRRAAPGFVRHGNHPAPAVASSRSRLRPVRRRGRVHRPCLAGGPLRRTERVHGAHGRGGGPDIGQQAGVRLARARHERLPRALRRGRPGRRRRPRLAARRHRPAQAGRGGRRRPRPGPVGGARESTARPSPSRGMVARFTRCSAPPRIR